MVRVVRPMVTSRYRGVEEGWRNGLGIKGLEATTTILVLLATIAFV